MPHLENHSLYPGNHPPLFISAGIFKEAFQLDQFAEMEDPSLVPTVTMGVFTQPKWQGNATGKDPEVFVYYPDKKMAGNALNMPNNGVEGLLPLKEPIRILSNKGIKTILQIAALPHENAHIVLPQLAAIAASLEPTAIEVDLSCQSGIDREGNLKPSACDDPEVSMQLMIRCRSEVGLGVTLGAKDSPHATSLDSGIDTQAVINFITAINPYVNFVTGVNSIGNQSFPEITSTGGRGGMSGPIIAPIAREWLLVARQALDPRSAVLSCGGVDSQNAATEIPWRLENGAMLVGGAQEFYRSSQPAKLAVRWVQEYVDTRTD